MSDVSSRSSDTITPDGHKPPTPVKRKSSAAGLEGNPTGRPVKRRASKACQCCRSRKVRCNVTEHGAPCTNCRLDEVECIVSESRRKKKWTKESDSLKANEPLRNNTHHANNITAAVPRQLAQRQDSRSIDLGTGFAGSTRYSHDAEPRPDEHVPHSIYQTHGQPLPYGNSFNGYSDRRLSMTSSCAPVPQLSYSALLPESRPPYLPQLAPKLPVTLLPLYIKPLPPKIGPDEISYLEKKGALTVPSRSLRNQLIRAYIEYVHPYMPLLDLLEFLTKVDRDDGTNGQVSLILFQAVMFAGSAFVDIHELQAAGYQNRKDARKDFFQRTRLLYDFDYDSDRVSLVQALLLLTYYYETPDDQKDTWHWMGVATSVAYTIGLHRNPEKSNMDPKRAKLWKRIWWSTYMRDRLIALGMRRPTRIKDQDADVPMLTMDDFDLVAIPDDVSCVSSDCFYAKDVEKQRQLAVMCIEKAKLCVLISLVLSKQYCVLNNQQGIANDRTTMMLLPRKLDPTTCEVQACDAELQRWFDELPAEAQYNETLDEEAPMNLHKSLLHMCYHTTLSALHRPQVLPAAGSQARDTQASEPNSGATKELLEMSRVKVRHSAKELTNIAAALDKSNLTNYLPTTGVTCLLPAIIIHLLDVKSDDAKTRKSSLRGFCQCMQVMGRLREMYAAADYSVAFLEAAIRKAGIQVPAMPQPENKTDNRKATTAQRPKMQRFMTVEDLVNAGRAADEPVFTMLESTPAATLTPPPDNMDMDVNTADGPGSDSTNINPNMLATGQNITDAEVHARLEKFLASTPPSSDGSENGSTSSSSSQAIRDFGVNASGTGDVMIAQNVWDSLDATLDDAEFDTLLNLDAMGGETFASFENSALQGESGGFTQDMDWMKVLA